MAIPNVHSYPLPLEAELPRGKVSWSVDPHRAALLIHDMQGYFLEPFGTEGALRDALVRNIAELRALCAARAIPTYFSAQPGGQAREERGLLYDFWGGGLGAAPSATAICRELSPTASDSMLRKRRYSAFRGTEFAHRLRGTGRSQLLVCGVYAQIGCLATALDAFMLDIQPFVVGDAVAAFSRQDHDMALEYTARFCGKVCSVRQVRQWLSEGSRPAQEEPTGNEGAFVS